MRDGFVQPEDYYEDLKNEQLVKEWKAKGFTDRDWTKLKVIFFDDNNKPQILKNDEYKKMLKDKVKSQMDEQAAALKDPKYFKKAEKDCQKVQEYIGKILEKFDEKERDEAEKDCCMCFNLMIESCILPCKHRFCIQCMRTHLEYGTTCPLCRQPVPSFFKMQYYHHNIDEEYKRYIKRKFPVEYEAAIQNSLK